MIISRVKRDIIEYLAIRKGNRDSKKIRKL